MKQVLSVVVLFAYGWLAWRLAFGPTADADFPVATYYLPLSLVLICGLYLAVYFLRNEKVKGEFVAKRVKRVFRWQTVLPTVTFFVIFFKQKTAGDLLCALSAAVFAVIEAAYCLRVKLYRPPGLVVDGDFLYFNDIYPLKRNLKNLYAVNITGNKNMIEFMFDKRGAITFAADEFAKEDLRTLIEIAICKSGYDVTIPNGIKYLLDIKEPVTA